MILCFVDRMVRISLICTILLAIAAAIGCGSSGGKRGSSQHLVVGAGTDVAVSGAFQARLGVYPLNVNVAEPLVKLAPDFRVEPALAETWEYRGENTWRFFLRRGVRFHDGQPLNAEAVRDAFVRHVKGNFGYSFLTEDSVKIVDEFTVDITPAKTNRPLPQQLVHPNYSIFAPNTDPASHPVGTGPFRAVEYRPHEVFEVERNEEYWGNKALPDRITFRFIPDPTTRVLALQAGEVDLIIDLPREQASVIESDRELEVVRSPVGVVMSFQLNIHGFEPYTLLTNRSIRRAIGHAIDRTSLVRNIWEGEGSDRQNLTVPAILEPYSEIVKGFEFDPEKARQVLESDGWMSGPDGIREKNGRKLQLVMLAHTEIDAGTVEFIQANLRAVGIDARWNKLPDVGTYFARQSEGHFDLTLTVTNQNDANPLFLPALIYYSKSTRPFARWNYVGEAFDALIEKGMGTHDPEETRRIAAQCIRIAIDEEAAAIPVAGLFRLYAMKKGVRGFSAHPSSTNQSWTQIYLE